jgi:hypothetical protein
MGSQRFLYKKDQEKVLMDKKEVLMSSNIIKRVITMMAKPKIYNILK